METRSEIFCFDRKNSLISLDSSNESCLKFGFLSGQRVKTRKGTGIVVGVKDDKLWFYLDNDKGCSFWENLSEADAQIINT